MFWFRDHVEGAAGPVEVAFTDASLDLRAPRPEFADALTALEGACGVRFARTDQVHGDVVVEVSAPGPLTPVPRADALVTDRAGVGLMVKAADCVPVVLADPDAGVVAAAHAGRVGMAAGVVPRALEALLAHGGRAERTVAWVGPHVCGRCYEVPAELRDEVAAVEPAAWAVTSWDTPSLDVGAGVRAQLARAGVRVVDSGGCTREDPRLHSHRRDGAASGRLAGLVWMPSGRAA